MTNSTSYLEFENNQVLLNLVGSHDRNLIHLEKRLGVTLSLRGNKIAIDGEPLEVSFAEKTLRILYEQLSNGQDIDINDLETALHLAMESISIKESSESIKDVSVTTKRRVVFARSTNQSHYIQAIKNTDLVFGIGPAGTGKTYLAVAVGVSMLLSGKVDRIILTRPALEAGEHLGFLPGDMKEKVDPYLRPLYDALHDMLPSEQVIKRLSNGEIEIAPLAFMRGRTLANSFVILDEAQNTTSMQMKMFLTRLGHHSKMVVTGDLSQPDLPYGVQSGLKNALDILSGVEEIAFIHFTAKDVVRHPLVSKIVRAYDQVQNGNL